MSERVWMLLVLAFAACTFCLTARGYVENTDAQATLIAADAFWRRGTSRLDPDAPDSPHVERVLAGKILAESTLGMPAAGHPDQAYVWFPIGHQALFLPAAALGDLHDRMFGRAPVAWDERVQPLFSGLYGARFFASFLSPLSAAVTFLCLVWLARQVGRGRRDALLVAGMATFATQFWPGSTETLSNMPGMALLFASVVCAVRARSAETGGGSRSLRAIAPALAAGLLGGAAVLVRYPIAIAVAAVGAWLVWDVVVGRTGRGMREPGGAPPRERGPARRNLVAFGVGGLPAFALLLVANWWRFGSLVETGYSAGFNESWMSFPLRYGVLLVLGAPGKGILLFSPPILLAFARLRHRGVRCHPQVLASLAAFVIVLLTISRSIGWGSGQCWGVRYLTFAITWFVAASLSVGPAPRWRALPTVILAVLGLCASVAGLITPYVGHTYLATRAALASLPPEQTAAIDPAHLTEVLPRYSPLRGHWVYAWLSATGRLETGRSEDTTEPLFGVATPVANPVDWTDAGFRHVWWRNRPQLSGSSVAGWLAALIAGCAAAALVAAWRAGRIRSEPPP